MSWDQSLTLPDGRNLSYTLYDAKPDPDRPTVFYFHGFPGTHSEGSLVHDKASEYGALVVGVTRPGFGDSTPHPDRTLVSFAADVLFLADHLGVQRFGVIGISGGGPYALACLHALPAERVRAVAVVSGMWPTSFSMAGMTLPLRIMHNLSRWVPSLIGWLAGLQMDGAVRDTDNPARFQELMTQTFRSWPAEDQEVIFGNGGKLFEALTRSSREAVKHGSGGITTESRLFGSDWGFPLEGLPVRDGRLVLWHGGKDANIPMGMAEQAAEQMPGVDFRRYDEEAHLSLCMKYLDEIVEAVVERLKR